MAGNWDLKGWLGGGQGMIPDYKGQGTKEMIGGENYAENFDNEGLIPDRWTGGVPTTDAANIYAEELNPIGAGHRNFDPSDPDQVGSMQKKLNDMGYTDLDGNALAVDSQMGGKTEAAYRKYMGDQKMATGGEQYRYDENKAPSKGIFGGLFKRGYQNLDQKMGGILPGGYKKKDSNVSYSGQGGRQQ